MPRRSGVARPHRSASRGGRRSSMKGWSSPTCPIATSRSRSVPALIVSLVGRRRGGTRAPPGTLAAQGDDEAMIAVIEQAMPAVVTDPGHRGLLRRPSMTRDGSDDQGQPEDADRYR